MDERISKFYGNPADPAPMMAPVPKYGVSTKKPVAANERLRLSGSQPSDPLLRLAQVKGIEKFERWYCAAFLEKHFPGFHCETGYATALDNDRIEHLVESWMSPSAILHDMDSLPTSGITGLSLWSDDYWRTQWGETSYRYQEKKKFTTYQEAIGDYRQPMTWTLVAPNPVVDVLSRLASAWSPAEKYDLTMGDQRFMLTQQQKKKGETYLTGDGNVEAWAGICHGWAPASLMTPTPYKKVTLTSPTGLSVTWYPHDIRAILSLAWSSESTQNNYAGSRCGVRAAGTYPNGRIIDQNCFDANPATFHLALANLIGKERLSFIMDKTYDFEIWNQPMHSYDFVYFNPLEPSFKSRNWREVAVDYNARFKMNDRFNSPNTRGSRTFPSDEGKIKKIVGVIATVVYLAEVFPQGEEAVDKELHRVTYLYDLEIQGGPGGFVPKGGEWHQNAHPDFLWIPRRNEVPTTKYDKLTFSLLPREVAKAGLLPVVQAASAEGYPLCTLVKELVGKSSDNAKHLCRPPAN